MIAPLQAHEGGEEIAKIQKDRERLIDLVLTLESDFGKTLGDYTKLQKEYASLLKRSSVPDQSGKVKELQQRLKVAAAKISEQEEKMVDPRAQALLQQDLINLRKELQTERQDLLVAKSRLLRVKQLDQKTQLLEGSLKKEITQRATTMGELQAIRGERDALLGKIKGLMTRVEEAEKGHREANLRIGELEKETNTLRLQLQEQEVELRNLRVKEAHGQSAIAAAADLKTEQDRLTTLLSKREKELDDLRKDLAVEMKRSLDIPVLIKTRNDLQKKLTASTANADGLKKKNQTLTKKQTQLEAEIATVQKSISAMQADLVKNKEALVTVAKLSETNQALIIERKDLEKTIAMAKDELVKSRGALQTMEAKLAKSVKESQKGEQLKKQNTELLAQQEMHKTQLASTKAEMGIMKKEISQNLLAMKSTVNLDQKVEVLTAERKLLNTKLEEAKTAHLDAEGKLKIAQTKLMKTGEMSEANKKAIAETQKLRDSLATSKAALKNAEKKSARAAHLQKDYDALTASAAELEKQKTALSDEMIKRDADLKKLRAKMAEMAKKPDMSKEMAKLQKEKAELTTALAKREDDLKKTRGDLGRLQLSASVTKKQLSNMKRASAKIDPVRYAKGAADVSAQQARVLTQVQQVLTLFPEARFEIVGHTCDLGSEGGNLRLSQQRAQSLQDFLLEKGVKAERLKSRGVGQAEPMLPNTSEANRRQNRRVVVEILD